MSARFNEKNRPLPVNPHRPDLMPLPSSESAKAFALDEPGATTMIALHTLGRAALIAPGIYLAGRALGQKDTGEGVIVKALGAAVALEIFAIVWFTSQVGELRSQSSSSFGKASGT